MVEMALVGMEGRHALGYAHCKYPGGIQQRQRHQSQEDGHRMPVDVRASSGIPVVEGQGQEYDDIGQVGRAGVSHEGTEAGMGRIVVEIHRRDTGYRRGDQRIARHSVRDEPCPEHHRREERQRGAQPVDSVDEVVGIDHQHHRENGKNRSQQRMHLMQAQEPVQVCHPHPGGQRHQRGQELHRKLPPPRHPYQVIHESHHVQEAQARKQHSRLEDVPPDIASAPPSGQVRHHHRDEERQDKCREKRQSGSSRDIPLMGPASASLVVKVLVLADNDYAGDIDQAGGDGQRQRQGNNQDVVHSKGKGQISKVRPAMPGPPSDGAPLRPFRTHPLRPP